MVLRLSRAYIKGHGGILGIFKMKGKKDSKVLKVLMFLFVLYLFLVFGIGFFSMFSVMVVTDFHKALILCCLYSLIGCMSMLFSEAVDLYVTGKDLEMLFSMPLSTRDVMLSRLLVLFEYTSVFSLLVMIPFAVSGALMCSAGISWYIGAIVLALMLSAFIASFVSFFAIVIPRKLRKPLYAICTVVFMFIVFKGGFNPDVMDEMINLFTGSFERVSISGIPLMVVSLILVPLTGLFLHLSVRRFDLSEKTASNERSGKVEYRRHGKIWTLVKMEAQAVRQSDGILFEIIGEVFIPLILIVIYAVMGIAGELMEMFDELLGSTMKNMMPLMVMMFSAGVSAVSSTSFSREGKVSELYGTLPLNRKERIDAKLVFHMIIEVPAGLLMMMAFSLLMHVDLKAFLFSIPLLIVFNLTVSCLGLLIDTLRPYVTWSEPVEAVKKNMNSMLGMALTLLDVLLCFLPYIIDRSLGYVFLMIWSMVVNIVIFPIIHKVLMKFR